MGAELTARLSGETLWLGVVLGGAVLAFGLCRAGIRRLRRALAQDAISAAIRPYRVEDLDQSARLAAEEITERHVRRGGRGFLVLVVDLFAWITGLAALGSAGLWWLGFGPEAFTPLGWLPYAPAVAVLTGFALSLYLLAHNAERRANLRLARWIRRVAPLSSSGYLDPDCITEFSILEKALLTRSHATQQSARDQVAELAHALLPQAREMDPEELKRTVDSAVAFVPRQSGNPLETDRFAELLTLFDALFSRLREDTGHQDIWRIAILRQLIRYTGPNVLPDIFGRLQGRSGSAPGLSVHRDDSVLGTAFGRGSAAPDGLDLIVDLTRASRERAD
ncbi:hypothetical protein [Kineosporia babensis]|uniref:Uncharacterized protein n=1 Tax=Kineosporia babensis TaxID=499548 RepID=A0A9X1N9P0_9ACTN|nr:hypothetical protein [Kineosporia babensis]MCD5310118.1 hypothetical protein [Kineosporia babensis]